MDSVVYNAQGMANNGSPYDWGRQVIYNYAYDLLNCYNVNSNGYVTTYTPDGMNQYTNVNGSMGYDGNLTYYQAWGGWNYSYNAENELLSGGSTGAPNRVSFTYDGLGRCLKRTIDGVTNLYVYDNWSVVAEFDGSNNFICWNVFGPGGADDIQMRASLSGVQFYHKDAHGNVMYIIDAGSGLTEQYRYDAFGSPVISDWQGANVRSGSVFGNRFMFSGREYFPQMGIYDYRHRWYQPYLGRFLQSDPVGLQTAGAKPSPELVGLWWADKAPETFSTSEINLFRYCGDDPVDRVDPLGLDPMSVAPEIDSYGAYAAVQALKVSEGNLDGKGVGLERLSVVYRDSQGLHLSDMGVGRMTNPSDPKNSAQTTTFPSHPGEGETAGHNHTHDQRTNGSLFSPADKNDVADPAGKPFYVAARDRKTGQVMVERYRPSNSRGNRDKHTDNATESLSPRQVKELERANKPISISEWKHIN